MQKEITQHIVISITIIVLVILFLGGIIISFVTDFRKRHKRNMQDNLKMQHAFNQQLLQSQIETQEETFSAIGKELHDNIGQLLNSTKLLIGVTQRTLKDYPDTLNIANETLGTAIHELRSLSKSLSKEWLQQFNFIENLHTEVKRINTAERLQLHFNPTLDLPFKSDEQIILFRIVQEALQNAIKHAHAQNVFINLFQNEESNLFSITIIDDGQGMSESSIKKTGVGIMNMQQRIKLLNGHLQWQSTPTGTTVTIQLPIQPLEK